MLLPPRSFSAEVMFVCVMVNATERKAKGKGSEIEFFPFRVFFGLYFNPFERLLCNDV